MVDNYSSNLPKDAPLQELVIFPTIPPFLPISLHTEPPSEQLPPEMRLVPMFVSSHAKMRKNSN